MLFRGRGISKGTGRGPILVSRSPISFLGGVDPESGVVIEKGHPLEGQGIAGTVLAFEHGKGSTVGSYTLYALSRNGHAPAAIVNTEAEPIVAVGAIIGRIPMIDGIGVPVAELPDGAMATVNGETGEMVVEDGS